MMSHQQLSKDPKALRRQASAMLSMLISKEATGRMHYKASPGRLAALEGQLAKVKTINAQLTAENMELAARLEMAKIEEE